MNPYTLIITSPKGSTVIPLGTTEAKNWQEKYAQRIKEPLVAELRPNNSEGLYPPVRIEYPKDSEVAFKIITQGRLFTRTGQTIEHKFYCLGWTTNNRSTYLLASEGGQVFMRQEEELQNGC